MIEYVKRLAGPFTAAGQTDLPFGFKIFEPTDVFVATSTDPNTSSSMLVYGKDYSVHMNPDQDAVPGGKVILSNPVTQGQVVVVGSAVAYTQNMQLTNFSRFPPEIINESLDRIVVQIQQLVELTGRTISLPPTSNLTVSEFLDNLFNAAKSAAKSAEEAKKFAQICEEIKQNIFIYSWDIPHVVDTLDDVEKYPYDGLFAVGGYGDPGHHGQDISNRVVKARGSTKLRTLGERFSDVVNVKDFGAVGNGVHDDTEAIQAAYDAVVQKGRGTIYFSEGFYRVTRHFDIYRQSSATNPVTVLFKGEGEDVTRIVADFESVPHAVFESIPSAALVENLKYWPRSSPTSFEGMSFGIGKNVNPKKAPGFIWIYGHGNSYLSHVTGYSSENTHFRSLSAQNVRFYHATSWFGGHTFAYKDTSALTFTTSADGTVTASADIFDSKDAGKLLTLKPSSSGTHASVVTIVSVVDARTAKVTGNVYTFENVKALFEPARISIQAGSKTAKANAQCFTPYDIGRVIFIRKGKNGENGLGLLRAVIVGVSASGDSVTLNEAADNTVNDEFFGQAAVEIFNPYNATDAVSSDVKLYQLHVEHYRGIGMVNGRCDSYMLIGGKIHGTTYETSAEASSSALWLDDADGSYHLTFDTGTSTTDSIAYACNLNSSVIFSDLFFRGLRGQKFVKTETMTSPSGCVVINGYKSYNVFAKPEDIIQDENSVSRTKVFGVCQAATGSQIYPYIGNSTHVDNSNKLIHEGTVLLSNQTSVSLELEQLNSRTWDINVTGSNFYLRDKTGNTQRLGISSSTGAVYPPTSKAQSLGNGSYLWSEVFSSTGTINTSDEREKTSIVNPDEALMRAWGKVNYRVFQFKDAVEKKGGDARLHVGVIAQQVVEAFKSEGLDASRYGLLCYDQWEDEYEDVEVVDQVEVVDEEGHVVTPQKSHLEHRLVTPAGDRYGIRYEEALALECAYLRWELQKIKQTQWCA